MLRFLGKITIIITLLSGVVFADNKDDAAQSLIVQNTLKIDKPYKLVKTIDLNKISAIVIPEGNAYQDFAEKIKSSLLKKNITNVKIVSDELYKQQSGNLIVVGDTGSNVMIDRLYWNWYTRMAPGVLSNYYAIQTIYSPIGVYSQGDMVVIGITNPASFNNAFNSFCELIDSSDNNRLSPFYQIYGGAVQEYRQSYFDAASKEGGLNGFMTLLDYYMRNNDKQYLDRAVEVLLEKAQENNEDPLMLKVSWADERNFYKAVQYWDAFCRFYDLSDKQRLDIDRMLISSVDVLLKRCSGYHAIDEDYITTWNHTNIPLLGIHTISRYLKQRYEMNNPLIEEFDTKAVQCFEATIDNYRPMEESIGYTLLAGEYNFYYYLMENKMEFVENGGAQRFADMVMLNTDNNGYFAGQGDVAQMYPIAGHNRGFSLLFRLTRDGIFRCMADRDQSHWFKKYTLFDVDTPAVTPEKYVGVKHIPIDKGMYELLYNYTFEYEPISPPNFPREMTFDKLQFRSSAEPEGEYMLVDGLGRGKHQHYDTNAIVAYVAGGYKFLFDSDYLCKKTSDHSILNVCRNGRSDEQIASCAGLMHCSEFEEDAFTASTITDYKGVDWTRNIYWEKEKYFAVLDTVRVKETAEYVLDCTWKILDRDMEEYDGKTLVCKAPSTSENKLSSGEKIDTLRNFPGQTFYLRSTTDNGWWDHRVSSREVPSHRIHQSVKSDLKSGDYMSFQNVFYVKRDSDYVPVKINEKAMLVDGSDWKLIVVDDAISDQISLRGKFVAVNNDSITAVKVESFSYAGDELFRSSAAVDISLNGTKLFIDAECDGQLKLAGIEKTFEFKRGTNEYTVSGVDFSINKSSLVKLSQSSDDSKQGDIFDSVRKLSVEGKGKATGFEYNSFTDMFAYDINRDGSNEIIVTSRTGDASVYDEGGKLLWKAKNDSGFYSATAGDIDKDGKFEVLLGTGSHSVIVFDADGNELRRVAVPIESSGRYGVRKSDPQWITVLKIFDIDLDGDMELVLGTRTWQVQIFDHDFQQQWYFSYNYHGVQEISFEDMDNDGVIDIVTSDRYGTVRVLDWKSEDFATSIKGYTATGDVSHAITDADNDGIKEFIDASTAGVLTSFERPDNLKIIIKDSWDPYYGYNEKWSFNNFGYSYYDVELLNNRDGEDSLLAASETGYIYSLNPSDGSLNWSKHLGSIVHTVSVYADKYIAAGTEKGDVFILNSDGKILYTCNLGGKICKIIPIGNGVFAVADTYCNISVVGWNNNALEPQ
ncbi:MAG: hypothetical protein ACIAQZ_08255 [Sedimentisphaeraceae bacterium JB056]